MPGTVDELVALMGLKTFGRTKCPLDVRQRVVQELIDTLACWLCIDAKSKPYNVTDWFTRQISGHYFDRPGKEQVSISVKEMIAEIVPSNARLQMMLYHYVRGLWIRYDEEDAYIYSYGQSVFVKLPQMEPLSKVDAKQYIADSQVEADRGKISPQLCQWRTVAAEALVRRRSQAQRKAAPASKPRRAKTTAGSRS